MSSISAGTTTTTGYVVSSDTTGSLVLKTGASDTTALTVNSSQNVGIGTSSISNRLEVNGSARFYVAANGDVTITHSGLVSSILAAGSISLALGTGNTERARFNTTGALVFAGGDTSANGIGITFPATQSASSNANTLDDYEEGTFNAGIAFGGNSVGVTYVTQAGAYVKTGRMVWCSLCIQTNSKGSSTGNLTITGLPFTASQVNGVFGVASEGIFNMNAGSGLSGTSSVSFYSEMGGSSTSVTCFFKTAAAQAYTVINNSNVENYFNYQLTICYQTST